MVSSRPPIQQSWRKSFWRSWGQMFAKWRGDDEMNGSKISPVLDLERRAPNLAASPQSTCEPTKLSKQGFIRSPDWMRLAPCILLCILVFLGMLFWDMSIARRQNRYARMPEPPSRIARTKPKSVESIWTSIGGCECERRRRIDPHLVIALT